MSLCAEIAQLQELHNMVTCFEAFSESKSRIYWVKEHEAWCFVLLGAVWQVEIFDNSALLLLSAILSVLVET